MLDEINKKIKLKEGLSGIIRYIGKVEGKSGEYAGIELDSPNGPNDGSYNGKRYFNCAPNHGLFVKMRRISKDSNDSEYKYMITDGNSKFNSFSKTVTADKIRDNEKRSYKNMSMSETKTRYDRFSESESILHLNESLFDVKSDDYVLEENNPKYDSENTEIDSNEKYKKYDSDYKEFDSNEQNKKYDTDHKEFDSNEKYKKYDTDHKESNREYKKYDFNKQNIELNLNKQYQKCNSDYKKSDRKNNISDYEDMHSKGYKDLIKESDREFIDDTNRNYSKECFKNEDSEYSKDNISYIKNKIKYLEAENANVKNECQKYKDMFYKLYSKVKRFTSMLFEKLDSIEFKIKKISMFQTKPSEKKRVFFLVRQIYFNTKYHQNKTIKTYYDEFTKIMKKYQINIK